MVLSLLFKKGTTMDSLHYLQNVAFDYYQQIPQKTVRASIYSFGTCFLIGMVFGNTQRAMTNGALAGIASLIYGIATPLFKKILEKENLSYGEEIARKLTAIFGALLTANFLNITKINRISFFSLIFLFAFTKDQNPVDKSVTFIFI